MFLWYWYSDPDPDFMLSVLTRSQINGWSDTGFYDPQYDACTLDSRSRSIPGAPADRLAMQQLIYQNLLTSRWSTRSGSRPTTQGLDGLGALSGRDGTVFYTEYNIDTFLYVHPVPATTGGAAVRPDYGSRSRSS